MKVRIHKLGKTATAGFNLVELIVVIAVLGTMAALVVPMISNVNNSSTLAKDKRNAQSLASVYAAATASGAALSTASLATAIDSLQAGVPGSGQFANVTFRINISDSDAADAVSATSMTLADGVLTFTP